MNVRFRLAAWSLLLPALFALGDNEWRTIEPSAGCAAGGRGIGLLDQIAANGRPPRAGGELALHVLEAMTTLLRSAAEGRRIELTTTAERPAPVPYRSGTSK